VVSRIIAIIPIILSAGQFDPLIFAPDEMRCIALLATSFGILLHTLLGWCPQHVGCASAGHDSSPACEHRHHRCQGHHHGGAPEGHGTSPDKGQVPAGNVPANHDPHCCDHADCLFVSHAESIQSLDSPPVCEFVHFLSVDSVFAVQLAELRDNATKLFVPCSQGQSARIARGVWLI
jgi:hypothetical protein